MTLPDPATNSIEPTTTSMMGTGTAMPDPTPTPAPENFRDSKAESAETATVDEPARVGHLKELKDEPGAKWKNKETHEIPYK
jgi:hypothetical protein